jgi:hypothetical protein
VPCPEPARPLLEEQSQATLRDELPRTYVGFRNDRAIPPKMQRRCTQILAAPMVSLAGGYDGMLSNANGLAGLLNQIGDASLAD